MYASINLLRDNWRDGVIIDLNTGERLIRLELGKRYLFLFDWVPALSYKN